MRVGLPVGRRGSPLFDLLTTGLARSKINVISGGPDFAPKWGRMLGFSREASPGFKTEEVGSDDFDKEGMAGCWHHGCGFGSERVGVGFTS